MPAREQGTSALKSGEAAANRTRGTEGKQSEAALSLLQKIPIRKEKDSLSFPLPKRPILTFARGFKGTENIWHLAASVPKSASV